MKSVAVAAMLCYIMAMGMALPSKVAVSEERTAETQWHLQAPSHGCVEVAHSVGGTVFRSYACDDVNGPCVFSPAVDTCPTSALFHKPNLERVVNIRSKDHLFRYYNQIGGACLLSLLPECCSTKVKASTAQDDDCFCITLSDGQTICQPWGCDHEGYAKSQTEDCRCETLPTGEKICDPYGCDHEGYAKSQTKDCRCEKLPTGEKICDPYGCDHEGYAKGQTEDCKCVTLPNGETICDPIDCKGYTKSQGNKDIMKALLDYIMKKN